MRTVQRLSRLPTFSGTTVVSCQRVADYVDAMPEEPLTNAAFEWMRAGYARLNAFDGPPAELREMVSADFTYEGRTVLASTSEK